MFAFDDAQVIAEGYDCRAEFGGRGDQPAGYVSTGHIDTGYTGQVLENVQSNVGRPKPGFNDFSVRSPIPGRSKRIDHVRAEQVRVAVRE